MGYSVKPLQTGLYGSLLRLYPQPFRQKYSSTMEQTFADMLQAEQSKWGRTMLWARALVDLPISAGKEHLTNGKDFYMNRNTKLILAGAVVAIIVVGLAAFWKGNLYARSNVGIVKVSSAQLADAMQQDDFYSTYGDSVVLFTSKVSSVKTQGNASLVTFATSRPYKVTCQFPKSVSFSDGQEISVVAPAGSADRETSGVLLHNCLQN